MGVSLPVRTIPDRKRDHASRLARALCDRRASVRACGETKTAAPWVGRLETWKGAVRRPPRVRWRVFRRQPLQGESGHILWGFRSYSFAFASVAQRHVLLPLIGL